MNKNYCSAWVEIDLKALGANFRAIDRLARKQFIKGPRSSIASKRKVRCPEILAVVKANAYGHGMKEAARVLARAGVYGFAVSDLPEALDLRKQGIRQPIVLFETTLADHIRPIVSHQLTPTVCTLEFARALNACARAARKRIDVHVKVDTGMGRLGIWHKDARAFIRRVMQFSHLSVKGIYTHFPAADIDPAFTKKQIQLLSELIKGLDREANIVPFVHASNSMGLAGYETRVFNLVRPGLMLYGMFPSEKLKRKIKLKPVMQVKTRVIFLKKVTKGRSISYGRTFVAPRAMTVATLPVGYNDGYFRCYSNKARVLINGTSCPVVGRVTMDQLMVDVSRAQNVRLGTEAVILGRQKKAQITADELAGYSNTINYEVTCSLGNRLEHFYKK